MVFLTAMIVVFMLLYQKKLDMVQREKESIRFESEQILLTSKIEIRELTIEEVSRDFHDNIGQQLAFLQYILRKESEKLPEMFVLKESLELTEKITGEFRAAIRTLNAKVLEREGIVEALREFAHHLEKSGSIKVNFSSNAEDLDLSPSTKLILYRIVQEAVSNALKHADCSELNLSVISDVTTQEIRIVDNGKGFATMDLRATNGINNMQKRAQLIGAKFLIRNPESGGTEVLITYQNPNGTKDH